MYRNSIDTNALLLILIRYWDGANNFKHGKTLRYFFLLSKKKQQINIRTVKIGPMLIHQIVVLWILFHFKWWCCCVFAAYFFSTLVDLFFFSVFIRNTNIICTCILAYALSCRFVGAKLFSIHALTKKSFHVFHHMSGLLCLMEAVLIEIVHPTYVATMRKPNKATTKYVSNLFDKFIKLICNIYNRYYISHPMLTYIQCDLVTYCICGVCRHFIISLKNEK